MRTNPFGACPACVLSGLTEPQRTYRLTTSTPVILTKEESLREAQDDEVGSWPGRTSIH